jgi:hypothetical protein
VKRLGVATALLFLSGAGIAAKPVSLESAVAAALGETVEFTRAPIDLNQDGRADAVVLVRDANWCGSGGCFMLIFKGTAKGYSLVSRSTITSTPVRILPSSHFGWRDLIVYSNGTGDVVLRFNGVRYPFNPSLELAPTPNQLQSAVEVLGPPPNNSSKVTPEGAPQPNR